MPDLTGRGHPLKSQSGGCGCIALLLVSIIIGLILWMIDSCFLQDELPEQPKPLEEIISETKLTDEEIKYQDIFFNQCFNGELRKTVGTPEFTSTVGAIKQLWVGLRDRSDEEQWKRNRISIMLFCIELGYMPPPR